jgi:hypothetical protein
MIIEFVEREDVLRDMKIEFVEREDVFQQYGSRAYREKASSTIWKSSL